MAAAVNKGTESREEEGGRTVVVSGVPDVLPVSRMIDKLMIHFQSPRRSNGGDVEEVKFPTNMDGVAFVTFEKTEDAERVLRKEQHIMMDDEFPDDYLLTVFPFTRDVFFYVPSAVVDLSVFTDQASLIQSLRSAHRSLRFQPFLQHTKTTVEGPFAAVQALRDDLIRRASRLKPPAVRLKESPLNPRVTSHPESVASKAKPGLASCLSTPLQTTGETQAQSLPSNVKTRKASSRRKVSPESLAVRSFGDTQSDEEEHRHRSRTERAKASSRQVLNAGDGSSLSDLDLVLAEELSSEFLKTRLKDVSPSSKCDTEELSPEDSCVWVDSYTFRYIEKFDNKEFVRRLKGLDVSIECKGADLVCIQLTESKKSTSEIRQVLERLTDLVEVWQSMLRVHQIDFEDEKKQEVMQICDDVSFLYSGVLYVLEDCCVKVIGSSVTSHLFCQEVEDRISKVKDTQSKNKRLQSHQ